MKKLIYSFLFVLCSVFALQAESMVVATYNLRNANAGDSTNGNGWGQRYPYIAQLVQFHGFDIFGTQEGKYHQLQDLKNAMPGYDYIGVGRDDGKQAGEYSAIFYRTGKFEMLLLVLSDRNEVGLIQKNIRRHKHRIRKKTDVYVFGCFEALVLKLSHTYGSYWCTGPCGKRKTYP